MNRYLMAIKHFFRGAQYFEIDAENKADAVQKGKEYAKKKYSFGGNYDMDSVKCIKKLQKKRGGK